jgi:hypothetical protein
MERVVHKAKNFEHARRWDVAQQLAMTPEERQAVARELKRRAFGGENPDVREAERAK